MSRLIQIVAVAFSLLIGASTSAQSLAEAAKKEKERRKQNEENQVKVIDVQTLTQGWKEKSSNEESLKDEEQSEEGPVPEQSQQENSENSSSPVESSSSSESAGEILAKMEERRRQCGEDLEAAEQEKKRLEQLFDQGPVPIATIDGEGPKGPEGGTKIIFLDNPPVQGGDPIDVEGTRVPCREVMRNSAKYPSQAKECKEIKKKLDAAEKEIEQALDCVRKR